MFREPDPPAGRPVSRHRPGLPGLRPSSPVPVREAFAYTFDPLRGAVDAGLLTQLGVNRFALYVQDYGAPVGYRLALRHPERVTALVVQNGNAYEEGLRDFWTPLRAAWSNPIRRAPEGRSGRGSRSRRPGGNTWAG